MSIFDEDDRYHRQSLITWWDQDALAAARVLLVGAGALGNEIGKNLALVGFGHVTVVDMDRIERSNLARCALFRESDEGRFKAEVLAERMVEVNPGTVVEHHVGRVEDLGTGVFEDVDLAIAGLDSRVARLWVNRAARKMGKPWVDGAIEGIRGVARVFLPEGPCYECTLGETDRKVLAARRSCALLTPEQMLEGKVPTNATTAAIIGGIEVQEAIKLLHRNEGLQLLSGRAFMFSGEMMDTYTVDYVEDEYCLSHEELGPRRRVEYGPSTTFAELVASELPGAGSVQVRLDQEVVRSGACSACGTTVEPQRSLRSFGTGELVCPECEQAFALDVATKFAADDPLAHVPIESLGLAQMDVATLEGEEQWLTLLLTQKN